MKKLNPNRCGIFGLLIMRGVGGCVIHPPRNYPTAETSIFILHQQSASHMKAVISSFYLIHSEVAEVISLASVTSRSDRWQHHRKL